MSKLRISDAPLLPDVNGTEKIPTGGRGDYAISVDQIKDHIFQDVGKELVGLGSVDNTSDLDKPVSTAQQAALDLKADKTYVDTNLDLKADKTNVYTRSETTLALSTKADLVGGVIPSNQLPSYVDDVVEYTTNTLPIVGEIGKIYITTDTNRTWRWSGNQYVEVSNGGVSDSTLKLQTPRKIANVDFDGTQNIDIPHNNLKDRDASGAHPAEAIFDVSGKNQQQINDVTAAKLGRMKDTYDLMTASQIQDVKNGVSSFDASGIIQSLIIGSNENTITIKSGVYFIGSSGIQLTGVKDKRIIFEKGAILKWHPLVTFSSNAYMLSLTDCENITLDSPVLRGANNPSIWVKTEKVIRAGLVDKQTGIFQRNCKNIKLNSPDIQNFQFGIYTLSSGLNKSSRIEITNGYLTGNYCGIVWESYIIDGITSCDILNTRSNNNWKWGMWMEAGDLSKDSRYIRNIKMIGGSLSGQVEEHGCYVQGEDHLFSGVDIENNNTAGLRMYSCARLRVVGNKFTGNGFNANGIGYLAGAAFIGTDTDGSAEPIRSNNVVFSDNVSTGNRLTFVDYKLDNSIIIANNVCTGNGTADGLTDGDIVFRSNQNSKISNNIIRDSLCATGILVRDQGNSLSKNIDVNNNMVIGQKGIGIKYLWMASEADSELVRITGNTVKGATSHGIHIETLTRQTRGIDVVGNNVSYCGGVGIKHYVAATASIEYLRCSENTVTFCTDYGIEYGGVSGGTVLALYDKNNHVQRNNSSGVQIFQPSSGGATYGTNQLVASGMRRTVTFYLKDVAVAASGEIQLKLDGVIPYGKNSVGVRVKAIEFYSSKGITGGSLSATVRTYTGVGTGTNLLSAALTATIASGNQDKSVTNAMNSSADRILSTSKYYVGVDMNNPVVSGGGTIDLLCNIILDYSDDWRFEVAL